MNVKKRLEHIAIKLIEPRRMGTTTALVKAAKDIDAIVLAANIEHAKQINHQFDIVSKSISTNLDGLCGPFILDHYATSELLMSAVRKIEQLENKIEELNAYLNFPDGDT